jgi:hypothetical protein
MPDHFDYALPLGIERSPTELRTDAATVTHELAKLLDVDDAPDGISFGMALVDKARLLGHVRAPRTTAALRDALALLQQPAADQVDEGEGADSRRDRAFEVLHAGLATQQAVMARRQQVVAAAQQVLTRARQQLATPAAQPLDVQAQVTAAEAAVQLEQAISASEANGAEALRQAIGLLQQAITDSPNTAEQVLADSVRQYQHEIAQTAPRLWADLAELIWRFDAHIQNRLTAKSDMQVSSYQLGRALAECYWALNPDQFSGAQSWTFLLGASRGAEISRLLGRLADYMKPYSAPAITRSLMVWHDIASNPEKTDVPTSALYRQIRVWYELTALGEDPTAFIKPYSHLPHSRVTVRVIRAFWGPIALITMGAAALVALIVLLSSGTGSSIANTLLAILVATGVSAAGLSTKRFRQDLFTDLTTSAITIVPSSPPTRSSSRM